MTRSSAAIHRPSVSTARRQSARSYAPWALPLVLLGALVASFWSTIVPLCKDWQGDQNYSVGQLVPFAALYLLWTDRRRLAGTPIAPSWWGVVLILLAVAARIFGLMFLYESAERYALVLTVAGLVLLVGGKAIFWKTKWILLFLFLMVPLPGRVHNAISGPLQEFATTLAVGTLEMLGVTVAREGNTMVLNDSVPVAVAEACSGLRMLTAFVVVSAVMAYVFNRPRWQKAVLLLSSVPVAILCNQIRLVITAWLFLTFSSEVAEKFFHDFAGLAMMPLAVIILVGELWVMSTLVLDDDNHGTVKTKV